VLIYVVYKILI